MKTLFVFLVIVSGCFGATPILNPVFQGTAQSSLNMGGYGITNIGTNSANYYLGNGSGITNLNASNIALGTISTNYLPSIILYTNSALNASNISSGLVATNYLPTTLLYTNSSLNGARLVSGTVPISSFNVTGTASSSTYLRGDGSWASVSNGTVTSVALSMPSGLTVSNSPITNSGTLFVTTSLSGIVKATSGAFTNAISGTDYAPATSGTSILYGNGSGGFSNVTIGSGITFTGGTLSSSSSGGTVTSVSVTVPNWLSVSPATITNSGTFAITANTSNALPAYNGSALTNLNGSNIASGVVATNYLPTNVAYLNRNNTFTQTNTFDAITTVSSPSSTNAAYGSYGALTVSGDGYFSTALPSSSATAILLSSSGNNDAGGSGILIGNNGGTSWGVALYNNGSVFTITDPDAVGTEFAIYNDSGTGLITDGSFAYDRGSLVVGTNAQDGTTNTLQVHGVERIDSTGASPILIVNDTSGSHGSYISLQVSGAEQAKLYTDIYGDVTLYAGGTASLVENNSNARISINYYGRSLIGLSSIADDNTHTLQVGGTLSLSNSIYITNTSGGSNAILPSSTNGITNTLPAVSGTFLTASAIATTTNVLVGNGSGGAVAGYPYRHRQVFTSSGTFTNGAANTAVEVIVTGAGGGGPASGGSYLSGGGAGGTAIKTVTGLTNGQTITVTVGTCASTTSTGGSSSFGSYCTGNGGSPGSASSGQVGGGAGGSATGGDLNMLGGDGLAALTANIWNGGTSYWGGGHEATGGAYGTGGASTIGAPGVVVVEWIAP